MPYEGYINNVILKDKGLSFVSLKSMVSLASLLSQFLSLLQISPDCKIQRIAQLCLYVLTTQNKLVCIHCTSFLCILAFMSFLASAHATLPLS